MKRSIAAVSAFVLLCLFLAACSDVTKPENPGVTVDKTALQTSILVTQSLLASVTESEDGNGLAAGTDYASKSDCDTLSGAISSARAVSNDAKATETQVNDAKTALDSARAVFTKAISTVPGSSVDKTALQSAISNAAALLSGIAQSDTGSGLAQGTQYAAAAVCGAFQDAISAAQFVYDQSGVTQAELNSALAALDTATGIFNGQIQTVPVVVMPAPVHFWPLDNSAASPGLVDLVGGKDLSMNGEWVWFVPNTGPTYDYSDHGGWTDTWGHGVLEFYWVDPADKGPACGVTSDLNGGQPLTKMTAALWLRPDYLNYATAGGGRLRQTILTLGSNSLYTLAWMNGIIALDNGDAAYSFGPMDADTYDYQWMHLALTIEAGKAVLYVNGEKYGEVVNSAIQGPAVDKFVIGGESGNDYFFGFVTGVRLYNDVLNAGEIAALAGNSGGTTPVPVITGVSINPQSAAVQKGGTQSFSATVTGIYLSDSDKNVTWSVEGVGGSPASGTSIDADGKLTIDAAETLATLTVKAVSTVDTAKIAAAAVTVASNSASNGDTSMLSISAVTTRPQSGIFEQNSPGADFVNITVSGINGYSGASFWMDYTITDIFGQTVQTNSIEFDKSGGASQTKQIPIDKSRLGYFNFMPSIPGGAPSLPAVVSRPAGFITWAVLVDHTQRRQKAAYGQTGTDKYLYFGMALSPSAASPGYDDNLDMAALMGIDASTSGELAWRNHLLGTAPNQTTDVTGIENYKPVTLTTSIYNMVEMTPYFPLSFRTDAGQAGAYGGELNATGETELVKYVQALAALQISAAPQRPHHYYQILWEPVDWWQGWTPGGDEGDASIVRVYQLAYAAIHAVYDQKADATGDASWKTKPVVLGPTYSDSTNDGMGYAWHQGLFDHGLANYIDGLSIHPYDYNENALSGGGGLSGTGNDAAIATSIRQLVSLVNSYYNARDTIQYPKYFDAPFFWGTEQGMQEAKDGPIPAAQILTRYNLIMLGEGFDSNHMFNFADTDTDTRYGFFYNLDTVSDGYYQYGPHMISPKPAASAFAAASWLLKGYKTAGSLALGGTNMGYKYQDTESGSVIYALWNYGGVSSPVTVPLGASQATVYDITGNSQAVQCPGNNISLTLNGFVQYVKVGN